MPAKLAKAPGIDIRHTRSCASRDGGNCDCAPAYQAHVYDARSGRRIRKTFPTFTAARNWRQDALVALRQGKMRAPTRTKLAEAAEALTTGMWGGAILDRSGKPYKPSTCRGYERDAKALCPSHSRRFAAERRSAAGCASVSRAIESRRTCVVNYHSLDPLRVIFRRAIHADEITVDATDRLDLPAVRGRRDRIESPEYAHQLLGTLPDEDRAFWAVALFAGLRRGELRALRWRAVDFDAGTIKVEASWDPTEGEIEVKSEAGNRTVPLALVVRRELREHKLRTGRSGSDLVFGRTASEPFYASTVRARALKAWGWKQVSQGRPYDLGQGPRGRARTGHAA